MQRRDFIAGLGLAAAWPLAARAQQLAVPVIGLLGVETPTLQARQLSAFHRGLSETGYVFGSQIGPCGLLVSISTTNAAEARAHFAAGRRGDIATLMRNQGELQDMIEKLLVLAADGARIDSAYDKILWKLHDPEFPLRLLPPYEAAHPTAAEDFHRFLAATYPHWAPADP